MIFVPLKQTTLLIGGTGPAHDANREHLFVVLTSPNASREVLLVPICSYFEKCDKTCVLEIGCHSFIKRRSFVMYAKAKLYSSDSIVKQVKDAEIKYMGLISNELFDKILDGLLDSKLSPPWARTFLNENTN